MSNLHGNPDHASEIQSITSDLLPACILSQSWPVVPGGGGLTFAPFGTHGYVRDSTQLVYVQQNAAAVTLTGADGDYWLALHRDIASAVSGWTRQPGTHYVWRASATQPADPPGGLLLTRVVVSGGSIASVDLSSTLSPVGRIAFGSATGALTFHPLLVWNATTLHLGVRTQAPAFDLDVQAQTTGARIDGAVGIGTSPVPAHQLTTGPAPVVLGGRLSVKAGLPTHDLHVSGQSYLNGPLGVGIAPDPALSLLVALQSRFNSPVAIMTAATPTQPLDVNGNARILGAVGIGKAPDGNYSLLTASPARFDANVGIKTAGLPTQPLDVEGNARLNGAVGIGVAPDPTLSLKVAFAAYLQSTLGVQRLPRSNVAVDVNYNKAASQYGLLLTPTGSDADRAAVVFANSGDTFVGSITTTFTTTAYNTTSDARLKHAIEALAGALDVVRALRPVRFLWKANDEPGAGFLAHELQAAIPAAVTGTPDAVREDGSVQPQQTDQAKLVPYLTAAVQELLARVEALEARLA